jgi:hypothetical protein
MPDYGDRDMPGYIPGVTGKRSEGRGQKKVTRPRARRNGLPPARFYVTDQVREYYAAQGRTLAGRPYLGTGRDTLTGHLEDAQLDQEA